MFSYNFSRTQGNNAGIECCMKSSFEKDHCHFQYKQTKQQNQLCLSFSAASHLNMDAIMHEQFSEKTERAEQSVFEVSASF